MSTTATEALKEALEEKTTDKFEIGNVIRWVGGGRYNYAAIKTNIGWFTTARGGNGFVEKVYDYEELVEMLAKSDVSYVEVATSWEQIS